MQLGGSCTILFCQGTQNLIKLSENYLDGKNLISVPAFVSEMTSIWTLSRTHSLAALGRHVSSQWARGAAESATTGPNVLSSTRFDPKFYGLTVWRIVIVRRLGDHWLCINHSKGRLIHKKGANTHAHAHAQTHAYIGAIFARPISGASLTGLSNRDKMQNPPIGPKGSYIIIATCYDSWTAKYSA